MSQTMLHLYQSQNTGLVHRATLVNSYAIRSRIIETAHGTLGWYLSLSMHWEVQESTAAPRQCKEHTKPVYLF